VERNTKNCNPRKLNTIAIKAPAARGRMGREASEEINNINKAYVARLIPAPMI
jgi:hypothetical protein